MSKLIVALNPWSELHGKAQVFTVDSLTDLSDIVHQDVILHKGATDELTDMLNDGEAPFVIGGVEYQAGNVVKEIDPILFNEMLLQHIDNRLEDLTYEFENWAKPNQAHVTSVFCHDVTITDVKNKKSGEWIHGIHHSQFEDLMYPEILTISELHEHIITEELSGFDRAFRDYLDEKYGWVEIFGGVYYASQILSEMDESDYNQYSGQWLEEFIKEQTIRGVDDVDIVTIPFVEKYAVFRVKREGR